MCMLFSCLHLVYMYVKCVMNKKTEKRGNVAIAMFPLFFPTPRCCIQLFSMFFVWHFTYFSRKMALVSGTVNTNVKAMHCLHTKHLNFCSQRKITWSIANWMHWKSSSQFFARQQVETKKTTITTTATTRCLLSIMCAFQVHP